MADQGTNAIRDCDNTFLFTQEDYCILKLHFNKSENYLFLNISSKKKGGTHPSKCMASGSAELFLVHEGASSL